jgi:hypothetical protein
VLIATTAPTTPDKVETPKRKILISNLLLFGFRYNYKVKNFGQNST